MLLVHDANPVYALPKAAGFAEQLTKVPFKVSTSLFLDETAALCDLLLPQHHALERWDDLAAAAGVRGLMQPVMEPVFNTRAAGDILLQVAQKAGGALAEFTAPSWEAHLKTRWQALAAERKAADAEGFWRAALQRGGVFDEAPAAAGAPRGERGDRSATPSPALRGRRASSSSSPTRTPMLYDGRGANKPWLLENADPVTKITWHSWVEVQPRDGAARSTCGTARSSGSPRPTAAIEAPAYIYPGLHPDVVAVPLGLGPHRVRGVRQGPWGQRARPARRPGRDDFLPYLSTRVTLEQDRRLPEAREDRGHPAPARPRHRRGDAARRAAQEGPHGRAGVPRGGHGEHEVNTEREVEALKGWREQQLETTAARRLRRASIPQWGMAIDLAQVHRLPGLRHRLLRGEQHPDRGRGRRSSRAAR